MTIVLVSDGGTPVHLVRATIRQCSCAPSKVSPNLVSPTTVEPLGDFFIPPTTRIRGGIEISCFHRRVPNYISGVPENAPIFRFLVLVPWERVIGQAASIARPLLRRLRPIQYEISPWFSPLSGSSFISASISTWVSADTPTKCWFRAVRYSCCLISARG